MVFNLFKKKKESTKSQYESVRVNKIIKETEEAITIVFDHPIDKKLEYKPGQYLTCICDVEGVEERRCYSLNTSPYSQDLPAITIKKDPEGKVSNFILENIKEGDSIQIIKPTGTFTAEFNQQNQRHFVMVAGGSGITPLMSILTSALIKEPESFVTLIYANRHEGTIIFKDKLQELSNSFSDRLKVIHILSQPSNDWNGLTGRLTTDILSQIIKDFPKNREPEFYLCGPSGLMDLAENYLISRNIDPKKIRKERFTVEEKEVKPSDENTNSSEVTLELNNQEYVFTVKPGKSILEAALDNDISMPYSCQSGICSTCRCLKLEGEMTMDEDEGLTEEEITEGYVLICVGHPVSQKLKLKADG